MLTKNNENPDKLIKTTNSFTNLNAGLMFFVYFIGFSWVRPGRGRGSRCTTTPPGALGDGTSDVGSTSSGCFVANTAKRLASTKSKRRYSGLLPEGLFGGILGGC